jgi:FixJ family two-component response regulator
LAGTVYVVDDDASFRTAVERRLKKAGYAVATYLSAQQLLDHLLMKTSRAAFCLMSGFRI